MSNTLDLFKAMLEIGSLDEVDEKYLRQTINKCEAELKNRERAQKVKAIQNFREALKKLEYLGVTISYDVSDLTDDLDYVPIFDSDRFEFD